MVNTSKLKGLMAEKGIKITVLASKMGISRQALSLKLNGKIRFSLKDVSAITGLLNLNRSQVDLIFFDSMTTDSRQEEVV
jgi:transcriptional regulator with XRE-family HTH domain